MVDHFSILFKSLQSLGGFFFLGVEGKPLHTWLIVFSWAFLPVVPTWFHLLGLTNHQLPALQSMLYAASAHHWFKGLWFSNFWLPLREQGDKNREQLFLFPSNLCIGWYCLWYNLRYIIIHTKFQYTAIIP